MSPDAVSASHVAPMIVIAAMTRIKIPIANVINGFLNIKVNGSLK